MTRYPRIVIPGCPHHVVQRGNHRRRVFFSAQDMMDYLLLQSRYFSKYGITQLGDSLMTNHVHHVVIPEFEYSLAKGFGMPTHDYSFMQNRKNKRNGHLWQARFYSNPVDMQNSWLTVRYAELNAVRAGLVKYPWDWPWSSARAHITGVDETGLLNMDLWRMYFTPGQWKEFLMEGMAGINEECMRIRNALRTGHPLGSPEFIRTVEIMTGRVFSSGRRRKS